MASKPIQSIVAEIIAGAQTTSKLLIGSAENYCRMMIDIYSNGNAGCTGILPFHPAVPYFTFILMRFTSSSCQIQD